MPESLIEKARMHERMLHRLLLVSVLLFGAVTNATAQQAQSLESSQPLKCGEKQYKLRLLTAEAVIKTASARGLAIALSPDDGTESKVFGVYWIGATNPLPTHRDDDGGKFEPNLQPYKNGNIDGVPAVQSFFSKAKCSPTDSQVIGIQQVIGAQGLLNSSRQTSITLRDVATDLSTQGVNVNADQVKDASAGNQVFFKNVSSQNGFAQAIRQYLINLLVTGGQTDPGGGSKDDEIKRLQAQNIDLQSRVNELTAATAGLFGGTPAWVITVLPFMTVLSVGGITLFGIGAYHVIQLRSKKQSRFARWLGSSAEAEKAKAAAAEKIENELKELHEDSGGSGGSASPEVTRSIKTISETLQTLSSNVGALKKDVDSFSSKLDVRTKVSSALQNIWHRMYTTEYSAEQTDKLVKDVGQVIDLYIWLRSKCVQSNAPIDQTSRHLQSALSRLEFIRKTHLADQLSESVFLGEIVEKLQAKLARDAKEVSEFKAIETALFKYTGKPGSATETVTKLINDHREVRRLEHYVQPRDFTKVIDAVVNDYQQVSSQVKRVLPNQSGGMRELVTALATEYLKVEPEAKRARGLEAEKVNLTNKLDQANIELKAGKMLVDEIALEFNFKPDSLNGNEQAITATLNRLKTERESRVYLQLRFGLSSALIALEKTNTSNGSEERNDVVQALHLDKVKSGIQILLRQMEGYTGEELWHNGLSEGFSQKWLHYLIRADLLLGTYYADQKDFSFLRRAISLACSTILIALHEFQVEVVEVGLLAERPKEIDTEAIHSGIRNLPAVRDKIGWKLTNTQIQELVVDVTSFPYFVKGVQENRGRAALANPSAWVQH